ncbi:putative tail tape measure protein [Vibrio phage vB_VnaS-L3]|nr:putative tail tape measure protein [Vibrio phage vB_VnaS-L3]
MADIVSLGFKVDTSQIEKGYKRFRQLGNEADKAETKTKKLLKRTQAIGVAFSAMGTAASASVVAIAALMNHLANVERELQSSARMAGLTVDQFEAMGFAYRQFGLTVEQVNDIYKDSRERVGEWLNSQSGALQDFGDAMGMSKDEITAFAREVDDLNGQQLLQRMVNDLEVAGVSGNQLSGVMEAMASEATRMIPALENNGQAINDLKDEYNQFNAAFSLDKEEVQNYADLAKNFDLFLDTAQNGMTKVLAPLAGYMATLANATTHYLSSLKEGSESALSDRLVEISEEITNLNEAIEDNESIGGRLKNSLLGFADGTSTDSEFLSKKVKELKEERKKIQEELSSIRFDTRGLIDTSKPLEVVVSADVEPKKEIKTKDGGTGGAGMTPSDEIDKQAQAYSRWIAQVQDAVDPTIKLREEIDDLWLAMLSGDIDEGVATKRIGQIQEQIDSFKTGMDELDVNPFESMTEGAKDALSAMSGMFESGSKDAKKLAVAMQALNLIQAVGAVLNQGNGDPYTAFGRMAAMASAVASLGMSIGSLGGGLAPDFEKIQANQGLNQWGEKAESIADATDMTANATEKLVGINTDMLEALKGLNLSILAASGIVARGNTGASVNTSSLGIFRGVEDIPLLGDFVSFTEDLFDGIGLGFIGDLFGSLFGGIGSLLGGKSKVSDEGIRIMGGALNDLLDEVTVQAFQTVKYKKWRFGSSKSKTAFENLGDEVSNQIGLVFESIVDSVVTGAEILGLSNQEISAALDAIEIETKKISLKGMSAGEQQEAINNYFSQVFNQVASDVVPFLEEFQQVGEELGATLSRLATEVNVAEYLVDNFGLTFGNKMADPKAFVQAANNLANLAGGVEELADQVSGFTNAFATDAQKFQIYQDALTSALGEVGLSLPSTAESMFELMSSLDGTAEAGQEQIATLLGLTDTASAYFKLLDKTAGAYREAAEGLFDITEASRAMSLQSALAAARMGDFSLAEQLDLGSIAPSTRDFNTALEYNLARAETAARLNELADLQAGQVTVEDKQLTVLEQIRDKLATGDTMGANDLKAELMALRNQMNRQQTETNDYLRRMAYQGA